MAELKPGVEQDARLLEEIVDTAYAVLAGGALPGLQLTDDLLLAQLQQVVDRCHEAAAEPAAVTADVHHRSLLEYDPQATTDLQDLLNLILALFIRWPANLRAANQRLPASQWMLLGSFFRQGVALLRGDPDIRSDQGERVAVKLTPLAEELAQVLGTPELIRAATTWDEPPPPAPGESDSEPGHEG